MSHIRNHSRPSFPHASVLVGLPLLGIGVVSSCASSVQPPPRSVVILQPAEETDPIRNQSEVTPPAEPQSQTEPARSQPPVDDEPAAREVEEPEGTDDHLIGQVAALNEEVRSLYRRLHIELPQERRSALIVELLRDSRVDHQVLGFELADRDLSASAVLSPEVGQAGRSLIESAYPEIRARSARLITRLVPPDAMIVLTGALVKESDPIAAEPMLLGIARWPNADATSSVLQWTRREDAPLYACFSAAWSIEREGMWSSEIDHPVLLEALRKASPRQLREDGMKLLALIGSTDDQRRLVDLMLSEDAGVVRWAASALVETPRAVEVLEQAAMQNEVFYLPAGESLIQHRATPDGLRRLSELPQSDAGVRRDMILRMGAKIDREQLGEAVRLARLEPQITIEVLSSLVRNEVPHTPRSAKSVLTLAELQIKAGRPNRAIEALLSLEGAPIDPGDQGTLDQLRSHALLLLSRFDEAASISLDFAVWNGAIELANDAQLKAKIAGELLSRAKDALNEEQVHTLESLTKTPAPVNDDAPASEADSSASNED